MFLNKSNVDIIINFKICSLLLENRGFNMINLLKLEKFNEFREKWMIDQSAITINMMNIMYMKPNIILLAFSYAKLKKYNVLIYNDHL